MPVAVATIGYFDGVHLGHRHVIRRLRELADRLFPNGGAELTVVTFDRHPRTLFNATLKPLPLMSLEGRIAQLKALGVDNVHVLTFDKTIASMPARDFMKTVLYDELHVRGLLLGYDNRFGKRVEGEGFADYVRYGKEIGIHVELCDKYVMDDDTVVSSTQIRNLIAAGDTVSANKLLGKE